MQKEGCDTIMITGEMTGGNHMAKTFTSTDVKRRYNEKTYKRIILYLRYDEDAELLEFIEANKDKLGTTQMFREALEMYIEAQK